jgi:hypothetical protein
MGRYEYLGVGNVLALHEAIMRDTGQAPALLRDIGLLESAVMRPQMAAHYEDADLVTQAAYLLSHRRHRPGPSLRRWQQAHCYAGRRSVPATERHEVQR